MCQVVFSSESKQDLILIINSLFIEDGGFYFHAHCWNMLSSKYLEYIHSCIEDNTIQFFIHTNINTGNDNYESLKISLASTCVVYIVKCVTKTKGT